MPLDLGTLNENQRHAVLWNDGPMLVLAGPGSGKTRVLAMRVARLVEEDPDASVLALTFTNKAAAEMRERVDHILGQRADRAHLCTFHSYATEVLRQHGSHLGVRPDFTLLTLDEDRLALLEPVVRELEDAGQLVPADRQSILRLLDHLFRESYEGGASGPGLTTTPKWVPPLFERYCESLVANNRQDFGSLLHLASRLLRDKPGVARVLRIGWSHVCIDEFQDTNKAQFDLMKLLVPSRDANLFVVGDDDQIIYQWNGASPERLQALRADYDMELVQLPENYRCPSEIIDLANRLIRHNKLRTPGKTPLLANRAPTGVDDIIRCLEFPQPEQEADFVAKDILARGAEAPECVVLARTTKLLESVSRALQGGGLTPYLAKKKNDFESPPVRVLVQALRLANARHDREILRRICVAWGGLTNATIEVEDVVASATLVGGDFLRAWADAASDGSALASAGLLGRLRSALVDRLDFPGVVDWFLDEGWAAWKEDFGEDLLDEVEIWRELHGQYLREHGAEDVMLHGYLQSMDLASKVPPPPRGAVQCLTVHGSKGLEFKHVYLIGMSQEVLPSFQALKKGATSRELEEERRNCFVAITRAQATLTLTRSSHYNGWPKAPSQFLIEMAGDEE
ncbi:MAG: ATP-dependent helicase [Dehalococcoidia bacterium]